MSVAQSRSVRQALVLVLSGWCLVGVAAADDAPAPKAPTKARDKALSDREKAMHLLSRLSFGPRPGDVERVLELGRTAWIDQQLEPDKIPDEQLASLLAGFKTLKLPISQLGKKQKHAAAETRAATVLRAVRSNRQLFEVLVYFWRNHFNVDHTKGIVKHVLPAWDRDVIRKHLLGPFLPFLKATAKHPAMLEYLDNVVSQKPVTQTDLKYLKAGSRFESRFLRQRGLNENYARELLELHTLGVDNFYKQKDVRELSRVLTGWTFDKQYRFLFRPKVHDYFSSKKVLRLRIPRRGGVLEGDVVLQFLAKHRGTSKFIALKLCRYLMADQPDPAIVDEIAQVFRSKKGDLKAVVRAIVTHPRFYDRSHYRAKFKAPFEFMMSALRAVGAQPTKAKPLLEGLRRMSQNLYACADPTGYYDTAEAWRDPGVMIWRWRFCLQLTRGELPGARVSADFLGSLRKDVSGKERSLWPELVAKRLVPTELSKRTLEVIRESTDGDDDQVLRRIVALVLGSPEFQQQ